MGPTPSAGNDPTAPSCPPPPLPFLFKERTRPVPFLKMRNGTRSEGREGRAGTLHGPPGYSGQGFRAWEWKKGEKEAPGREEEGKGGREREGRKEGRREGGREAGRRGGTGNKPARRLSSPCLTPLPSPPVRSPSSAPVSSPWPLPVSVAGSLGGKWLFIYSGTFPSLVWGEANKERAEGDTTREKTFGLSLWYRTRAGQLHIRLLRVHAYAHLKNFCRVDMFRKLLIVAASAASLVFTSSPYQPGPNSPLNTLQDTAGTDKGAYPRGSRVALQAGAPFASATLPWSPPLPPPPPLLLPPP